MPPPPQSVNSGNTTTDFSRAESYSTQYFQSMRTNIPTLEENAYVITVPPADEDEHIY